MESSQLTCKADLLTSVSSGCTPFEVREGAGQFGTRISSGGLTF